MNVHFIDTSVFCNILDVPGKNQQKEDVMRELRELIKDKDGNALILPFATIVETGNHIAHCPDGNIRRKVAIRFIEVIKKTVNDDAPWQFYSDQFSEEDLLEMCRHFPDAAMSGMAFGDVSIVQAYNRYKQETPAIHTIRIWSIDTHLKDRYVDNVIPQNLRNSRH